MLNNIELGKLASNSFDLLQLLELKEQLEYSKKVKLELENELSMSRLAFQEELKHVQGELGWSTSELAKSKLAIEDKDMELHKLSEQLYLARLRHFQYEETACNLQGEVMFLGLKLQNLEADSQKSNQKLKNQYYKYLDEWMVEKVDLKLQIEYLEQQLQQIAEETTKATVSRQCSPSHGSIQSLIELGEAFDIRDEELQHLRTKLKDAETRESLLVSQLKNEAEKLAQLETGIKLLKEELESEKEKFKEDSEDMAQEMAELRYQFTEMLEVERDLRARTEQASVHRVEELETQVDRVRKQLIAALARRREAELQLEKLELKIVHLNNALESERHQKHKYTEIRESEKEKFQLQLQELQERFLQLEKEKNLMEVYAVEHSKNCNQCGVLCLLAFDNKRNGLLGMGDAKLAQFDNGLMALYHKSGPPVDRRPMKMDVQVMSECRYFPGDRTSCADRKKFIQLLDEEHVNLEFIHAQYERCLKDETEVENVIQYGLELDIQLLVLSGSFELEFERLRYKLIESVKKATNSEKIVEEKDLEIEQIKKQVDQFKLDIFQYQDNVANQEDEIAFLKEELRKSDAEREGSSQRINNKHAKHVQECEKEKISSLPEVWSVEAQSQESHSFDEDDPYVDTEIHASCVNTKVPQVVSCFDKETVPLDDEVTLHEIEGYFQDLVALGEASLIFPEVEEHFDDLELEDAETS